MSVERLLDPSLRGRPVVVGGRRGGRGVVTSASYEVRAFGVRSGMSIHEASERAPADAVFVPGHGEVYGDYSVRAREIVERFSPIVIAASIDEHYLDFTGCERMYRRRDDTDDDATILRVVREMTATIRPRARPAGERGHRDEQTDVYVDHLTTKLPFPEAFTVKFGFFRRSEGDGPLQNLIGPLGEDGTVELGTITVAARE